MKFAISLKFKKSKGIYKIKCLVNNKLYIGSTVKTFWKRFQCHLSQLKKNNHSNQLLQNCFNKHGSKQFVFEKICSCDFLSDTQIRNKEEKYLKSYPCHYSRGGFNILKTSTVGDTITKLPEERKREFAVKISKTWTDKRKRELSKRAKKMWSEPGYRQNKSNLVKKSWTEKRREHQTRVTKGPDITLQNNETGEVKKLHYRQWVIRYKVAADYLCKGSGLTKYGTKKISKGWNFLKMELL